MILSGECFVDPQMELHAFATLLTYSSNVKAASSVTPCVFSLSDTVMGQPATVTVDGSGVLDNFCPVSKKQTFDFFGFARRSFFAEPVLNADGARLEALKVVFR